jgi:hypothetical protein
VQKKISILCVPPRFSRSIHSKTHRALVPDCVIAVPLAEFLALDGVSELPECELTFSSLHLDPVISLQLVALPALGVFHLKVAPKLVRPTGDGSRGRHQSQQQDEPKEGTHPGTLHRVPAFE